MPNREIYSTVLGAVALNTQTIATNTTTVGNEIDLQDYDSCLFLILSGTLTDGNYTPAITESDTSGGTFTAVADADLTNTEASAAFTADTDDNAMSTIGYIGSKRFVKISLVSDTTTSGALMSAVVVRGNPAFAPVTQPTATAA